MINIKKKFDENQNELNSGKKIKTEKTHKPIPNIKINVNIVDTNIFNVYICDMKIKKSRKYEMSSRAQAAENTSKDIMRVLGELWLKHSIHEITLEMIAEKAGITVRTVLRKYGSKEGLFEAALQNDPVGIKEIKAEALVGDIDQAVQVLMKEYEYTGMAGIRTLAIENEFPLAAQILKKGRQYHKSWCERVFAPYLPKPKDKNYAIVIGAFYAATDVYKWKLLRKDLGYSKEATEKIFIKTIKGIIKTKTK